MSYDNVRVQSNPFILKERGCTKTRAGKTNGVEGKIEVWNRTRKRQHYIDRIPLRNIGCKRALTTLDQTHGGTRVLLSVLHNQLPRPPLDHRTPLLLEGSDSDIDLDIELAAGSYTDVYPQADDINEQLALGERFSTLDSGDDNDSSTAVVREVGSMVAEAIQLPQGPKFQRSELWTNSLWRKTDGQTRIAATKCPLIHSMTPLSAVSLTGSRSQITAAPLDYPPFSTVYRDSLVAPTVHPNVNGTLTTQFSPAAFSITAVDLNVSTPDFEGGMLSLHLQYSPVGSHFDPVRDVNAFSHDQQAICTPGSEQELGTDGKYSCTAPNCSTTCTMRLSPVYALPSLDPVRTVFQLRPPLLAPCSCATSAESKKYQRCYPTDRPPPLAEDYSGRRSSGSLSAHVEEASRLLERNHMHMEKNGVSQKQLANMQGSLGWMKREQDLLGKVTRVVRKGVRKTKRTLIGD